MWPSATTRLKSRSSACGLWLVTFPTPHKAGHIYDAATRGFGRSRASINFPEMESLEEVEMLALEEVDRASINFL
jgi:hypothetical protein